MSWIKSYLLVLVILIIINMAAYFQTHKIIKDEINLMNEAMLQQMRQSIDTGLESIDTLAFQISNDTQYRRVASWTDQDINQIRFKPDYSYIVEAMKKLNEFKRVNPFVTGTYIYLRNSDTILSSLGFYDLNTFHHAFKDNAIYYESMSFDDWYAYLNDVQTKKSVAQYENNNWQYGSKSSIKIMQTLPLIARGQVDAVLVFVLDKDIFMNAINNTSQMHNGWTLILDSENQTIFSTMPGEVDWSPDYNRLQGKTGSVYDEIDGDKHVISYIDSAVYDWKYITVLPNDMYQEKVSHAAKIMTMGILISVAIGLLLAFYFSGKNYYPVDELVKMVQTRFGKERQKKLNEYHLIKEAVNTAMDENVLIKNRLSQQNTILKKGFLQKLVKGRYENKAFIESAFETYELNFSTGYFGIILFYITDFSKLFQDADDTPYEEKQDFVQFIVTNVVEELASQNNTGYMLEIDGMMTCLINFREENLKTAKQEMLRIAEEAQDFFCKNFDIHFKISISGVSKSPFGIPEAYKEVLDVMEYKTVMENNEVMFYEDIGESRYRYQYSIEEEYQLINCIRAGEVEAAKKIVDTVFDNVLTENASVDIVKCLVFDLSSTILKAMNTIDTGESSQLLMKMGYPAGILTLEKISEMREYTHQVLDEICAYIAQNKGNKREDQIDAIIAFIEENYTDTDFSVAMVAEKFNITSSYLTRLFKEHSGKGVLEYINRCRIERAKRLLKESEMSIKEISVKSGYYNINAFNRMFKKLEGITPSAFRG